jgi:hypothetical protein
VIFNNQPKAGKGPPLRLTDDWYDFVRDLNTDNGFRIATGPATGWVNEGWGDHETPLVQSLSMGGNVVIVRDLGPDKYARIRCYKGEEPPPDPRRFNYHESPFLIHKFTCITGDEKLRNPGTGHDSYFPLIGADELWLPLSRIEYFPPIPVKIQMKVHAFLRSTPQKAYSNVVGAVAKGQELTLRGYAPRGGHVWGFVSTAAGKYGYIALQWYPRTAALHYLTTWTMDTIPPLPPQ